MKWAEDDARIERLRQSMNVFYREACRTNDSRDWDKSTLYFNLWQDALPAGHRLKCQDGPERIYYTKR